MYKFKKTKMDYIFDSANYVFMVLLMITFFYPFWDRLVISFSTPKAAISLGLRFYTWPIIFDAYKEVFHQEIMLIAISNSIFRTVVGTILTLFVTYCAAYALSKKWLPYRNIITLVILFTMFFSGGLIPSYMLIKQLGLLESLWSLILPSLTSAWYIIIARNFIMSLPESLEESALLDGANPIQVMFKIMIPLSMPIIAVVALWSAVGHWNSWFDALIYIRTKEKMVLQLLLRKILIENEAQSNTIMANQVLNRVTNNTTPETVKAAVIIFSIAPIAALYPFFQKYFIKGIMIGALKG